MGPRFLALVVVLVASVRALEDYYGVLEISESATLSEVRSAYRRLVLIYHPDKNKAPDAEAKFMLIDTAYDTLSDPTERADYDMRLQTFRLTGVEPRRSFAEGFARRFNRRPDQARNMRIGVIIFIIVVSMLQYIHKYTVYYNTVQRYKNSHYYQTKANAIAGGRKRAQVLQAMRENMEEVNTAAMRELDKLTDIIRRPRVTDLMICRMWLFPLWLRSFLLMLWYWLVVGKLWNYCVVYLIGFRLLGRTRNVRSITTQDQYEKLFADMHRASGEELRNFTDRLSAQGLYIADEDLIANDIQIPLRHPGKATGLKALKARAGAAK